MRRSTLTIVLYLLLVFLSGIGVGAFGYHFVKITPVAAKATKPSPEEFRRQYLNEFKTKVKLTEDQVKRVNGILDETRARYHEARERHDQVMKTIKEEQRNKVMGILTDAQKPDYEKFRMEREQRAKAAASKDK